MMQRVGGKIMKCYAVLVTLCVALQVAALVDAIHRSRPFGSTLEGGTGESGGSIEKRLLSSACCRAGWDFDATEKHCTPRGRPVVPALPRNCPPPTLFDPEANECREEVAVTEVPTDWGTNARRTVPALPHDCPPPLVGESTQACVIFHALEDACAYSGRARRRQATSATGAWVWGDSRAGDLLSSRSQPEETHENLLTSYLSGVVSTICCGDGLEFDLKKKTCQEALIGRSGVTSLPPNCDPPTKYDAESKRCRHVWGKD